jgi:hypothetical protein
MVGFISIVLSGIGSGPGLTSNRWTVELKKSVRTGRRGGSSKQVGDERASGLNLKENARQRALKVREI